MTRKSRRTCLGAGHQVTAFAADGETVFLHRGGTAVVAADDIVEKRFGNVFFRKLGDGLGDVVTVHFDWDVVVLRVRESQIPSLRYQSLFLPLHAPWTRITPFQIFWKGAENHGNQGDSCRLHVGSTNGVLDNYPVPTNPNDSIWAHSARRVADNSYGWSEHPAFLWSLQICYSSWQKDHNCRMTLPLNFVSTNSRCYPYLALRWSQRFLLCSFLDCCPLLHDANEEERISLFLD